MRIEALRSVFAILVLGTAVSACGGGGGGGSSDPAPIPDNKDSVSAPSDGGSVPGDEGDRTPGSAPGGNSGEQGGDSGSDAPGNSGGGDSGAGSTPGQGGGDNTPAPAPVDRTALLTWEGPTRNADNSCLEDLKGYRISYGQEVGVYNESVDLELDELVGTRTGEVDECGEVMSYTFLIKELPTATWHFAIQAVDADDNVSDFSNSEQKTIGS